MSHAQALAAPRASCARAAGRRVGAALLAGCDSLSRTEWFPKVLDVASSR